MNAEGVIPFALPPTKEFVDGLPPGSLYLVATPIGNLLDISLRALHVLALVDLVAAEDTRRTGLLMRSYGLKKPLLSLYAHNEEKQSQHILSLLQEGKTVAMVSDAGMPGICDPGMRLVKQAVEAGVRLVVIPGASAGITALAASGLDTATYAFGGFFPRRAKEQKAWLALFGGFAGTVVFYESPKRLRDTLQRLREALGDRRCCVARELTKHYETFLRGSLAEVLQTLEEAGEVKGEIVVVMEGEPAQNSAGASPDEAREIALALLAEGKGKKEASMLLAKRIGMSAKACYAMLVELDTLENLSPPAAKTT